MKACPKCQLEKPLADFYPRRRSPSGCSSWCRLCERAIKRADSKRRWRILTPEQKATKTAQWRHGLSPEDKYGMWLMQGGRCAICEVATPSPFFMHVDHDHSCCGPERSCEKCRRGLACRGCNLMLGNARDDAARLRAGALYLERFSV